MRFRRRGQDGTRDRICPAPRRLLPERGKRGGTGAHQRVAARLRKIAPVAVRINPNVDAHTHAKITTGTYENKFGIQLEQVEAVYARAARLKNLRWRGVQMHIGSQLTEVEPFELAVKKVLPLVRTLTERHGLEFFSIGGGLGIVYNPALASGPASWWNSPAARGL
jgi:diaminopimelate decarboxylase